MNKRILTGTDLNVSPIALGTMMFGKTMDVSTAREVTSAALDMGINFVDTADTYNNGDSERFTGEALRGRRHEVVLATKGGYPLSGGIGSVDLSAAYIVSAVENSLRRLGTDHIDLYYLHAPDRATPMEETLKAVDSLVSSGKIGYAGVSNHAAWELTKLRYLARMDGLAAPCVTQNVYNLITRGIEREMTACMADQGVGLVVYNPLAGGFLSGKYTADGPVSGRMAWNSMYRDRFWKPENFKALEGLKAAADELGITLPELSYRWLLSQKHVDCILTGMSRLEQMVQNLSYVDNGPLPAAALEKCDAVWDELKGPSADYNR